MQGLKQYGCPLLVALSFCTSVNGQILQEACDLDSTCIDLIVTSATSGNQVVSKTNSGSLDQLVFDNGVAFDPIPLELSPDDGFTLEAEFEDQGFLSINLVGSQTILPTDQNNDPSQISGVISVKETVSYIDPSLMGFTTAIGYVPNGSGEFSLPEMASPGFMSVSITWDIQSVVNGNPVLTPLFSASLSVTEQSPPVTVRGRDSGLITLTGEECVGPCWEIEHGEGPSSEFQVREGDSFDIIGKVFFSINVDAYESSSPNDPFWQLSFRDIGLQLVGPDGGRILPRVPEPSAVILLLIGLASMLTGRSNKAK